MGGRDAPGSRGRQGGGGARLAGRQGGGVPGWRGARGGGRDAHDLSSLEKNRRGLELVMSPTAASAPRIEPVQLVLAHELVLEQLRTALALGRFRVGDTLPR